jgi:hypothetical protein
MLSPGRGRRGGAAIPWARARYRIVGVLRRMIHLVPDDSSGGGLRYKQL